MYRRDILIRSLTLLLQRLAELVSKKKFDETDRKAMVRYYSEMLNMERSDMIDLEIPDILGLFDGDTCKYEKIRVLAELFYAETMMEEDDRRGKMAEKTRQLFHLCNEYTRTFDFEIITKMDKLSQIIEPPDYTKCNI
jgi:hypothetical protein